MSDGSIPPEIANHYQALVDEDERIREGLGQIELERVKEIVRRHLPPGSLHVLDVGGATGVHAEWLLADGHEVTMVDPVASHVDEAQRRLGGYAGFSAAAGEARVLDAPDGSYDAVLLFGPLYHFVDEVDRAAAWAEARRCVRRGGLVFGMGITRFASLLDGLAQGHLFDPRFRVIVERDLVDGQHRNPTDEPAWFTTA